MSQKQKANSFQPKFAKAVFFLHAQNKLPQHGLHLSATLKKVLNLEMSTHDEDCKLSTLFMTNPNFGKKIAPALEKMQ
jgi:hypothetical protein